MTKIPGTGAIKKWVTIRLKFPIFAFKKLKEVPILLITPVSGENYGT